MNGSANPTRAAAAPIAIALNRVLVVSRSIRSAMTAVRQASDSCGLREKQRPVQTPTLMTPRMLTQRDNTMANAVRNNTTGSALVQYGMTPKLKMNIPPAAANGNHRRVGKFDVAKKRAVGRR